jgi:hypothetical protein
MCLCESFLRGHFMRSIAMIESSIPCGVRQNPLILADFAVWLHGVE